MYHEVIITQTALQRLLVQGAWLGGQRMNMHIAMNLLQIHGVKTRRM